MKQTVYAGDFIDAFNAIRPNQFTYEALNLLYEFLDESDPDYELDVIAICCDFTESTYEEVMKDYNLADGEDLNPEDIPQAVIDYLNDETTVIGYTDTTIIYLNF